MVGEFCADLLIENRVLAELKACRTLEPIHEAQVINYLRATSIEVGLLLHFAPKPVFRRFVLSNDRKPYFARRGTSPPAGEAKHREGATAVGE